MIATVTPNPCLDKTVAVEKFDADATNRVDVLREDLAGKGINVAKALRALGADVLCAGFDFAKGDAGLFAEELSALGISHDLVPRAGALRVCTKVFDQSTRRMIEFNERGATATEEDVDRLLDAVERVAKRSAYLTLCGSLPPGFPRDFYARCVRRTHVAAPQCRVIVDAEGEVLRLALAEHPFMIKPNIHELESTFALAIGSEAELDARAREILERFSLGMICVSMGGDGAYLADRSSAYIAKPARVTVRSLQGAGDCMVAGICYALQQGCDAADVLRYGVATSGAAVQYEGTQVGTRQDVDELLRTGISVRRIG